MVKSAEPKPDGDQNKDKNTLDIGLLEEDDEFEEFPVEGNLVVGILISGILILKRIISKSLSMNNVFPGKIIPKNVIFLINSNLLDRKINLEKFLLDYCKFCY